MKQYTYALTYCILNWLYFDEKYNIEMSLVQNIQLFNIQYSNILLFKIYLRSRKKSNTLKIYQSISNEK